MQAQRSIDPGEPGWRALRHFAYVDRPFRDVRRAVAAAPQRVVTDPAGPATAAVRVHRAGLDLARDVRMIIGDVEIGVHSARLPLRWEDARRPGLFPILDANLEIAPVRAGQHAMTQLGLFGSYRPPFGRLGALADDVAGHTIVTESVEQFLAGLVARLEATLPAPDPDDAGTPGADGGR